MIRPNPLKKAAILLFAITAPLMALKQPAYGALKRQLAAGDEIIGAVRMVDPNDDTRFAEFDSSFKVPIYITAPHHEKHEGDSYCTGASVDSGTQASLNIAFKVPIGEKKNHMLVEWYSESKAHFDVYEGRQWSTGTGTLINIMNDERNSANTSQLLQDKSATPSFTVTNQVLKDVTGATLGNRIRPTRYTWDRFTVGGSQVRGTSEFILKNNETITFELTSDDGNKGMGIILRFYEHTDQ